MIENGITSIKAHILNKLDVQHIFFVSDSVSSGDPGRACVFSFYKWATDTDTEYFMDIEFLPLNMPVPTHSHSTHTHTASGASPPKIATTSYSSSVTSSSTNIGGGYSPVADSTTLSSITVERIPTAYGLSETITETTKEIDITSSIQSGINRIEVYPNTGSGRVRIRIYTR